MAFPKRTINIGGEEFRIPDFTKIFGGGIKLIVIIAVGIWIATGIYIVGPDEQGVVRRFGKLSRVTSSGIHYHWPYPIEVVQKPKITEVKRVEIGFRTIDQGPPSRYTSVPNESLMLTGNLNIIDIDMIAQYKIRDAVQYLFNVRDVVATLHKASEAALRQVIGKHDIDEALTVGKFQIQEETLKQLQTIMDKYESGVLIVAVQLQDVHPPKEVSPYFKDVASAKEDREKKINQAQGYRNDIIPKARGEAEKMLREAEGFAARRVAESEGDAKNFLNILAEYSKAKNITRKRMLLETMEIILPRVQKYILTGEGTMNLLPLAGKNIIKSGN
ncbi:MAG: FtsH protease activity modulator HflK [candidate division Zixibacteria bacterium]|nr:FtsH protease activity modulator HflK [Candidatus Tariuqbacter arcticus]